MKRDVRTHGSRIAFLTILAFASSGLAYQACTIANDLRLPSGPTCSLALPPTAPEGGSAAELPDLVYAVRAVSFENDAGPAGYDLDHACTCGTACRLPVTSLDCGRADGIDNQGVSLDRVLKANAGISLSDRLTNERIGSGTGGFLVVVRKYNGEANDERVQVALFPSEGLGTADAARSPTFTEADKWIVGGNATLSEAGVLTANDEADGFVRDGVLVAHFSKIALAFNSDLRIDLNDVTLSGRFETGAKPVLQQVSLAGRWKTDDTLRNFMRFSFQGKPVCKAGLLAQGVPSLICPLADIPANPSASPQALCDALSFGVAMTLAPGSVGPFQAQPPVVDPCQNEFAPKGCN